MTEKSPTPEEAKKLVKAFAAEASEKLKEMGSVHRFEMDAVCKDKDGNDTQVLIIDTKREGILSMLFQMGPPITLNASGDMVTDNNLLAAYFGFMANIDLKDEDSLAAIGWSALSKGRELVSSFFSLSLASTVSAA